MRTIIEIQHIERTDTYTRTYAVVDSGDEVVGFGDDFKVGDKVEVFHDQRWDVIKMRHKAKGIDN